jgi:hypothetical protein
MGLLDTLLGRTKPVKPDLDELFALPSAAVTLEAAGGLRPTGVGSVCVKSAEGAAFAGLREQIDELLATDAADGGRKYEESVDKYGFSWLSRHTSPEDMSGLVTDLHAVNSTLDGAGFGPALLCTLVVFSDGQTPAIGLVYLFKRGTWYPFAPLGGTKRDNAREMQVRAMVGDDLKIETDLARWFPVWEAPGL